MKGVAAPPGFGASLDTPRPPSLLLAAFIALLPLQNIHTQYVPSPGPGLNFLNVMLAASILALLLSHNRGLVARSGINGWAMAYIAFSCFALFWGQTSVIDTSGHASILKDHLIGLSFLFLAQASVSDEGGIRRLLLASLLPLPYMAYVVLDQHASVSSWHYDHALRISGTFPLLGANEFAAFCTTVFLMATGLLLGTRQALAWRLILSASALCAAIGIIYAYSRTAYIATIAGLVIQALMFHRRTVLVAPFIILTLALPFILPHSVKERFQSIEVEEGQADKSTTDRFVYWGIAMERFTERPLLGTGYHTFHHAEVNPHRTDTHNFFLRELTEKGIAGFTILIGLFASIARNVHTLNRRAPFATWPSGLGLGLAGAFVALIISNLTGDRFTYYPMMGHFWLYLGLGLRAMQLGSGPVAAKKPVLRLVNSWNPPSPFVPGRAS